MSFVFHRFFHHFSSRIFSTPASFRLIAFSPGHSFRLYSSRSRYLTLVQRLLHIPFAPLVTLLLPPPGPRPSTTALPLPLPCLPCCRLPSVKKPAVCHAFVPALLYPRLCVCIFALYFLHWTPTWQWWCSSYVACLSPWYAHCIRFAWRFFCMSHGVANFLPLLIASFDLSFNFWEAQVCYLESHCSVYTSEKKCILCLFLSLFS